VAIAVLFNGTVYSIPETGDESWGTNLTTYLSAISQGALQKTGGNFTLTADLNLGANYGLLSQFFSSRTALPSTAGIVRLAVADSIGWRNNANGANLLLAVNGSNQLTFNGVVLESLGASIPESQVTNLVADLALKAPIASPTFTGVVTSPSFVGPLTGLASSATTSVSLSGSITESQVTNLVSDLALKAPLISPSFTTPALGTPASGIMTNVTGTAAGLTAGNATLAAGLSADIPESRVTNLVSDLALKSPLANPTFTGTVVIPTPFTIGAVSLTTTATKLNYLTSATGTTGTVSTNIVFSTSPTLITPILGTPQSGLLTSCTGLPLTTGVTGTLPIANGGTGQTTANAGFNALSPMTTGGDLIYGGASGVATRLPNGTAGQVLSSNGTTLPPTWIPAGGTGTVTSVSLTVPSILSVAGSPVTTTGTLAVTLSTQTARTFLQGPQSGSAATPTFAALTPPTIQKFTSGSGTYTTPTSPAPIYIIVQMVGGGGGGGGSGTSLTAGTIGGNSTFGTTLLVANGGSGGPSGLGAGGAGGTASLGTGPIGIALQGGSGNGGSGTGSSTQYAGGSMGGNSPFGGAGVGSLPGAGTAAIANTGSGGGGAGAANGAGIYSGMAGGAGGYVKAIISGAYLTATFPYVVGGSGAGGGAGAGGGTAGGAGGSGVIIVKEYYQ
jgi:hypothetical protein